MSLFVLMGCNSDGDETISLEYGNVKKMIVGQWVVVGDNTSGTPRVLTFTDDGYYTDSSDGGTRKHPWRLEGSTNDDSPYYGGIYLDGKHYGIDSLGDGHWILTDDNGKTLELDRDGGNLSEDDASGGNATTTLLVGSWKLVKQIDCDGDVRELDREYILTFTSDGTCKASHYRVFEAEIHGTVKYNVSGNYLYIDDAKYRIDKLTAEEMILKWFDEDGETPERSYFQKTSDTQSGDSGATNQAVYTTCPDANHPHAIDLGLPSGTKWACCNVGATTPEGYGGYYAWGETEEKEVYSMDTYIYRGRLDHNFDHLNDCERIGMDIAGTKYDVAQVKWGGSWAMPTVKHFSELIDNTTSKWITLNGIDGMEFIGSNNGIIFLPAAGYHGKIIQEVGENGIYWSATQWESYNYCYAYVLSFQIVNNIIKKGKVEWTYLGGTRSKGQSVRPIYKN